MKKKQRKFKLLKSHTGKLKIELETQKIHCQKAIAIVRCCHKIASIGNVNH